jgi:modulator of FtsH protease
VRSRSPRREPALFPQSLSLIAAAAGCFALGAYAGRHLATGAAIMAYMVALGCLLALSLAVRRREAAATVLAATVLMLTFGTATGIAAGRTVVYYAAADPRLIWESGGMAGMFTAACGVTGLLARPGLVWLARVLLSEILAMLLCGIVLLSEYMALTEIGDAAIAVAAYASLAVLGVCLLRRTRDFTSAPLLAAAVFAAPGDAVFRLLRHSVVRATTLVFR